ncbi:MAG: SDR family oxidoreductase [Bacteroidota bacterium]
MKILITGANGFLGQHLIKRLLDETTHLIIATGKGEQRTPFQSTSLEYVSLDLCDGVAVHHLMDMLRPDLVVHCAAMTQADECEVNEIDCWNINVTATRFLLDAAKKTGARFILLSTDFVFDGAAGPYRESDTANPVSYYGSSKVAAEKSVMESGLDAAVVRTCLVYGDVVTGTRNNIVTWVKNNLQDGKSIKVVSDQLRTPTYVEDLSAGIQLLIDKKASGVYHISGEELLSPYDMAIATADHLGLDKSLIEKVDASTFSQPAKRPARTGFVIDKAKSELAFKPLSFKEGLAKMF